MWPFDIGKLVCNTDIHIDLTCAQAAAADLCSFDIETDRCRWAAKACETDPGAAIGIERARGEVCDADPAIAKRTHSTARVSANLSRRTARATEAEFAWPATAFGPVCTYADLCLFAAKERTARIGERVLTGPLATHLIGVAGRTARTAVIRVLQEILGR